MHRIKIVQYLQNYKRHEFDQGHSTKLLQSCTSYIQIENTKTARLLFKGSWILPYFWHSNWHYLGNISGKVAKPYCLESPQESLKIHQSSNQRGHPLRNNGPLKIWKMCIFLAAPFSRNNLLTFGIFNESNIWASFIMFEILRYIGQCWSYGQSKLLLQVIEYRLDELNNKHTKIAVNSAIL